MKSIKEKEIPRGLRKYHQYIKWASEYDGNDPKLWGEALNVMFIDDFGDYPIIAKNL